MTGIIWNAADIHVFLCSGAASMMEMKGKEMKCFLVWIICQIVLLSKLRHPYYICVTLQLPGSRPVLKNNTSEFSFI